MIRRLLLVPALVLCAVLIEGCSGCSPTAKLNQNTDGGDAGTDGGGGGDGGSTGDGGGTINTGPGDFHLDAGKQLTLVNGTLSFGRNANLAIETAGMRKSKDRSTSDSRTGNVLKISGPLDGPNISVEKADVRQPAD